MPDKLIITSEGIEEATFTPEEIAQREYEASLPPIVKPKSDLEVLQEKYDILQGAVDFIVMTL